MSLKQRIRTLEEQARATAERDNGLVEMVMPWPGEELSTIKVPRDTLEQIVKSTASRQARPAAR